VNIEGGQRLRIQIKMDARAIIGAFLFGFLSGQP
jgi:hypothetical protein